MVRPADVDHPRRQAAHGGVIAESAAVLAGPHPAGAGAMVAELRALALGGLPMMFDPAAGLFCFRVERRANAIVRTGLSRRYTAVTLLGLSGERPDVAASILAGQTVGDAVDRLARTSGPQDSLGDLALTAWAAHAAGRHADDIWTLIASRDPVNGACPTVEVAWTLSAAAAAPHMARSPLGRALAARLSRAFSRESALFPHDLGEPRVRSRAHVSCFADLVYPVLALASWGKTVGDPTAIECARQGAEAICRHQGPDGQWWWHYDYRTGRRARALSRCTPCTRTRWRRWRCSPRATQRASTSTSPSAPGSAGCSSAPELQGGSLIDRRRGT